MGKNKFKEAKKQVQKNRERTAKEIGVFLEAEAKYRVTRKTGHLARSITHNTDHDENTSKVQVGTNVKYAQTLEEGSKAHTIQFDKPQRLKIKGQWVTVKKINHPGTKPQPYLKPSIEENKSQIQSMIKKGMSI